MGQPRATSVCRGCFSQTMKKLILPFLIFFGFIVSIFADGTVVNGGNAHTTSGSIARGCRGLTFVCGSGATCTVSGTTIAAGAILNVPFFPEFKGDVLGAVAYTVSGGTLYSVEVR